MNYKKIFILFLMLTQIFAYSQDINTAKKEIKDKKFGLAIGTTIISLFYHDRYGSEYGGWANGGLTPTIDLVYFKQLKNRYYFLPKLGFVNKDQISEGGVPYSFNYITFSSLFSYSIGSDKNKGYVGIGPYVGYLIGAKKGRFKLVEDDLKKIEFGIELLLGLKSNTNKYYNPFSFGIVKIQLGLTEILYFKTFSYSIAYIGFSF